MKKFVSVIIFSLLALSLNGKTKVKNELTVLAAASMTDVLNEVNGLYSKRTGSKILPSFASSGILQKQIEQGAPADVFISAGKKQMEALVEKGFVKKEDSFDFLENKIVLISNKDSKIQVSSIIDVTNPEIKMIGLGDFSHVPVGQYSKKIFSELGILEQVTRKANFGSNARTVLTWVQMNEVDVGVVYETDAKVSKNVKILAYAPKDFSEKVIYPAGIVSDSKNIQEAKKYIEFLKSDEVRKIFEKYGFSVL